MKLRFAVVCASNQNRSMEAHFILKEKGFFVESYGTGNHVKLPGPSIQEPNVYKFGTPYRQIYDDLQQKDPKLYTRNGLLPMLQRNLSVKEAPQRWQDNRDGAFDVVIAFEERVYDAILEDFSQRKSKFNCSVLVINFEVKDNHKEAASAAQQVLHLCQMLEAVDDWENEVDGIIERFQEECSRTALYRICFY